MSQRDPWLAVADMYEHAIEALGFWEGREREDLDEDRMLELSLVRLLEILGEAATRVPDSIRSDWPSIPWSDIVALRNRLIHAYDVVDRNILAGILEHDLPELVVKLEQMLAQKGRD